MQRAPFAVEPCEPAAPLSGDLGRAATIGAVTVAEPVSAPPTLARRARDLVALTKPRITITVALTAFGGYWLGTRWFAIDPAPNVYGPMLLGTALVVSGANALNMYLERDSDRLMRRTANRPLPAGRMSPDVALAVGLLLSALSIPLLTFVVTPLTGLLAAVALGSYVLAYTPLKRRSSVSLLVGAVPGAIPPLLGWSALRGTLDGPGLVLFATMFLWQVPHFLAIATFRRAEYARAGLQVATVVFGERTVRHQIVRYTAAMVLASLLLVPYGLGGDAYLYTALGLGGLFFGVGAWGLRAGTGDRWAKWLFLVSMVYLVGLFVALGVGRDAWVG
jgi:protoheme IX farnesyltransferase